MGQAQDHIARRASAGLPGPLQHGFQFRVVHKGDHGGEHHPHGNARVRQGLYSLQTPGRSRGPGLQPPRQVVVQGGDGQGHADQPLFRHGPQQIQVPLHQPRLGDNGQRVAALPQDLNDRPGDAQFALHRLVRVGVGPHGDGLAHIAGLAQRGPQQFGGIGLGEQLGLKIQTRGKVQVSMGGPGVAIRATMLAPPVGVDGGLEGDVRGLVPGDDGPRLFHKDFRGDLPLAGLLRRPAVIERAAPMLQIAAVDPRRRSPALDGVFRRCFH